ncbi:MAG: ribosomal protein S18-alanine N-acetyltransferase [Clostridia bacterium]|nr:ribosomal protein S18-alanine N-acetyltransferase [Clostridia bacterium]
MDNITITQMTSNDIAKVKELENEQDINILSENAMREDLSNPNYVYLIAKNGQEPIGYIAISKVIDTIDILSIVVKKNYQKQGVATLLLQYILQKMDARKVMLEVRKSNIPAQKLYEKLGFQNISIRKKYYPDNLEDAFIYEKII